MSSDKFPIIKVQLKPRFNISSPEFCPSIEATVTIECPNFEAGDVIAAIPSVVKAVVSLEHCLSITDKGGFLSTETKRDAESGGAWIANRKTSGKYITYPPKLEAQASPLDLHYDQRGFFGCGISWLPLPKSDRFFRNVVEWNLEGTPEGTRAVWTFGEGPGPVERIGPVSVLGDSVYMVGQIESNPPRSIPESLSDYYGYYWFGDLPSNIKVIKDIHREFFSEAASFLDTPLPSTDNPYRSFVRSNEGSKIFGGTCFRNSQIFDYDDQIAQVEDYDLVRRMAYEAVHHWFGPSLFNSKPDWFFQGIKNCLSHYFQATICVLCTRYYTNPLINLKLEELLRLAPTNVYAREQLEYRAWAFICGTDLRARRMSKLIRPIEDLAINPLVKERAKGNSHGIKEFLKVLRPLMGEEANQRYDEFRDGTTILLNPQLYGGGGSHYLKQVDQEFLDFGMRRESFDLGFVKDLKSGSRAEEVGLKEGDKIVWSSQLWRCVDHFEEKMKVVVEREGKEITFEYWPRAFEMAKSWQMVKAGE